METRNLNTLIPSDESSADELIADHLDKINVVHFEWESCESALAIHNIYCGAVVVFDGLQFLAFLVAE